METKIDAAVAKFDHPKGILRKNDDGTTDVIVHPDYLLDGRACVYAPGPNLYQLLQQLRTQQEPDTV